MINPDIFVMVVTADSILIEEIYTQALAHSLTIESIQFDGLKKVAETNINNNELNENGWFKKTSLGCDMDSFEKQREKMYEKEIDDIGGESSLYIVEKNIRMFDKFSDYLKINYSGFVSFTVNKKQSPRF